MFSLQSTTVIRSSAAEALLHLHPVGLEALAIKLRSTVVHGIARHDGISK